jgi:hypothetical protein
MAECAGDSDALQRVLRIHLADDADHRAQLEQRDRRGGLVERDRAVLDAGFHRRRKRVRVHFQTDGERGLRTDRRPDDFVHAQSVGPESLVAEGVEAEDLLPGRDGAGATVLALRGEAGVVGQWRDGNCRVLLRTRVEETDEGEEERGGTHHSPREWTGVRNADDHVCTSMGLMQ